MTLPPAKPTRVLVVDDSAETRELLRRNLELEGYVVRAAASVPDAVALLASESVSLVITDVKMPRVSGLELVRHVVENFKDTAVMVITGYPNVEGALEAIKGGATDYLTKPFTDEELLSAVRRSLEALVPNRPPLTCNQLGAQHGLLGTSAPLQRLVGEIKKAARTRATVLLLGESGTGKELVARAIHYEGERKNAPFVSVNCGAIPHELLESELFGHVKGAFTGASESRAGFFLTAEGGTLFLDEIAETSPAMQVKLLRVLQEREVLVVGSSQPQKVNVRVMAATNKDLEALIRTGAFREDLFYRLNVLRLKIPPLRERDEDVVLLTRHFADRFAKEHGREPLGFTQRALEGLRSHSWPGNVRELENAIQRLVVMADADLIDMPDLPAFMRFTAPRPAEDLTRTLKDVEKSYVLRVLESVEGNKSRAAQILDIDRKTLRAKLKDTHD
tara:strand:- start:424 stop:1767 length:1344 start_codon:yes stop_codon:yes gene_type:complete